MPIRPVIIIGSLLALACTSGPVAKLAAQAGQPLNVTRLEGRVLVNVDDPADPLRRHITLLQSWAGYDRRVGVTCGAPGGFPEVDSYKECKEIPQGAAVRVMAVAAADNVPAGASRLFVREITPL